MADDTKQYGMIPARLNWEAVDFDKPINQIPEEHRALYLRDYNLPDDYGTLRQRFGGAIVPAHGRIYAIGTTPEEAIQSFYESRGIRSDLIFIGDPIPDDVSDEDFFDWGFYVAIGIGQDGCKVAGMNVPGGTVLTWWK